MLITYRVSWRRCQQGRSKTISLRPGIRESKNDDDRWKKWTYHIIYLTFYNAATEISTATAKTNQNIDRLLYFFVQWRSLSRSIVVCGLIQWRRLFFVMDAVPPCWVAHRKCEWREFWVNENHEYLKSESSSKLLFCCEALRCVVVLILELRERSDQRHGNDIKNNSMATKLINPL